MRNEAEKNFLGMCRVMGWNPEEVRRKDRSLDIVIMKTILSRRLRDYGYSYHIIGDILNVHHSTVIHHIKKLPTKYENKIMRDLIRMYDRKYY